MLKQEESNTTKSVSTLTDLRTPVKTPTYQQKSMPSSECRLCRGEGRPFIGHSLATCRFLTKEEILGYSNEEDHYSSDECSDCSDSEVYSDRDGYDSGDKTEHISVSHCHTYVKSDVLRSIHQGLLSHSKEPTCIASYANTAHLYAYEESIQYPEECRLCYGEGRQFKGHGLSRCPFITKEDIVGYSDDEDEYSGDDCSDSGSLSMCDGYNTDHSQTNHRDIHSCSNNGSNHASFTSLPTGSSQIEHPTTSYDISTQDKNKSRHEIGVCNENMVLYPCNFCGHNDEDCDCDIITDVCILHQQSFTTNAPVLEMDPSVCYCGKDKGLSNVENYRGDTENPSPIEVHTGEHYSPDNVCEINTHKNTSPDCTPLMGDISNHCGLISTSQDVALCASIQSVEINIKVDEEIPSTGTSDTFEEDDAKDRSSHRNTSISTNHPRNDTLSIALQHRPPGFDISPSEQSMNITHCLKYMESLSLLQVSGACAENNLSAVPALPTVVYDTVVKDIIDCNSAKEEYGGHNTNSVTSTKSKGRISSLFISEEKRNGENVIEPSPSICVPDDSGNLFFSEEKRGENVSEHSASICIPDDSGDVTSYVPNVTGHTNGAEHCEVMSSKIFTSEETTAPACDLGITVKLQTVMDLCHSYVSERMEYKEKEATDPCDNHAVRSNVFSLKDTRVASVVRISLIQVNVGLFWSSFIMSPAGNLSLPPMVPVLNGLFYNHAPRPPEFHVHCFIPVADRSEVFEALCTGK